MHTPIVPEVGSEWQHRDGRKMRVESVSVHKTDPTQSVARMVVLNPKQRQRMSPIIQLSCFCDGDGTRALSPSKA